MKTMLGKRHYHKVGGHLYACYHECKSILLSASFWIGLTCSFPLEHFIWEKLYPFNLITKWLGL